MTARNYDLDSGGLFVRRCSQNPTGDGQQARESTARASPRRVRPEIWVWAATEWLNRVAPETRPICLQLCKTAGSWRLEFGKRGKVDGDTEQRANMRLMRLSLQGMGGGACSYAEGKGDENEQRSYRRARALAASAVNFHDSKEETRYRVMRS